jgi:dTDP-4-amino-4,6-dideoxygalactose transaminase
MASAPLTSAEPAPNQPLAPVPVVDFKRQYATIREDVLQAITAVCDSQQFILGTAVTEFEVAAGLRCNSAHAIGCSSGTDALWLALTAAGVQPGDAVITTPFSFFATVSSILRAGAVPVLADIDPLTYNLDMAQVGDLLRSNRYKVAAVMPVHLYGQCADISALRLLRQPWSNEPARYDFKIIEDAAQAFGARWEGRMAGSLGDAAAFSFYPTKNLSCFGDGGMVTTDNAEIAEMAKSLRAHGMRKRYHHDDLGWNCRLDSLQAAVLIVKLRYIDEWNRRRREVAALYDELFTQAGIAIPLEAAAQQQPGVVLPWVDRRGQHVFHQYVVRVGDGRRDDLREHLRKQGISSEVYYPVPLHRQKALAFLGYKEGDFPATERAARKVLALPIFPEITPGEQERVVAAVAEFWR